MSIKRVYIQLFLWGIFLLPFFDSIRFSRAILGPFRTAAFTLIFLGAVVWFVLRIVKKQVPLLPRPYQMLLGIFIFVVFLSGVLNANEIYANQFGAQSGLTRYFMALALFAMDYLIILFVSDLFANKLVDLRKLQKYIVASFFLAGVYSLFELGWLAGIDTASAIMKQIDTSFRGEGAHQFFRISSLTKEPSTFAMYSAFIFPWLLAWLYSGKHTFLKSIVIAYFVLLNILSFSRTGYLILLIEALVFFWITRNAVRQYLRKNVYIIVSFVVLLGAAVLMHPELIENIDLVSTVSSAFVFGNAGSDSNITRYGVQAALLQIAASSPFWGVGYEQAPFFILDNLPSWAWSSGELVADSMENAQSALVPSFNYFFRVLAELGCIGFIAWISIWLFLFKDAYYNTIVKKDNLFLALHRKCLLVSLVGSFFAFYSVSDIAITNLILIGMVLGDIRCNQSNESKYDDDKWTERSVGI